MNFEKNQDATICCQEQTHFKYKEINIVKVKRIKTYTMLTQIKRKLSGYVKLDKVDFVSKYIKEKNFLSFIS